MCRKIPHGVQEMSADTAVEQIKTMMRMESEGWGDQDNALRRIARRFKIPFGTLDNLRTGRTSRIMADVRDQIRFAYLSMIEEQVRVLQHQLEVERAKGAVDDDLEGMSAEAEALLQKIKARRDHLDWPKRGPAR